MSGQPYVPAPSYGQGPPYAPQPQPGGPGGRSGNVRTMIIIVVVTVVLVAAVVTVLTVRSRSHGGANTAVKAAQKYLEAIAANRSAEAIALLKDEPYETGMLTDAVLKASHRDAPMTEIRVRKSSLSGQDHFDGTALYASYKLGDHDEYGFIYATQTDDGWKVVNGLESLRVASSTGALPKVTLNGVKVTAYEVQLFPGRYTIATDSPNFEVESDKAVHTAEVPYSDHEDYVEGVEYRLTSAGRDAAQAAVEKSALACIAKHTFVPGCGLGIDKKTQDGKPIKESTIRWSISDTDRQELKSRSFEMAYDSPTMAELRIDVEADLTAKTTDGETISGDQYLGEPQVDVAADPMTVGWA